jgi:hypothetical protein
MNARLSGQWGTLFPNMHIQCPARILYINGFKGLRQYLDWKVSKCVCLCVCVCVCVCVRLFQQLDWN